MRHLIRRMAAENQWGATRIHGELLRLGFDVSERTVSRYLRQLPSRPERRQSWRTFMKNHREVVAAMDFFTVPTASFRLLYVLFVIRLGRRDIAHERELENSRMSHALAIRSTLIPVRVTHVRPGTRLDPATPSPARLPRRSSCALHSGRQALDDRASGAAKGPAGNSVSHPDSRPSVRWGREPLGRSLEQRSGLCSVPSAPLSRPRRTSSRSRAVQDTRAAGCSSNHSR